MPTNTGPVVGVDLGVKTLATLSDGTEVPNPRHLKQRLKKLKRLQRAVSRKQKGSHNRRRRPGGSALSIAEWPISAPTRCINSPADWRKPSQSW